jgi:nitrogen fixation NifU-like protein
MDEFTAREMYKEIILDNYRNPKNFGKLTKFDKEKEGNNPLCGDNLIIQLKLNKEIVTDVKFHGCGCAISMASASLLTESIKGKSIDEIKSLKKDHILKLLNIPISPARLKCALLSLQTLQEALK